LDFGFWILDFGFWILDFDLSASVPLANGGQRRTAVIPKSRKSPIAVPAPLSGKRDGSASVRARDAVNNSV
jgi:hypothetical protein